MLSVLGIQLGRELGWLPSRSQPLFPLVGKSLHHIHSNQDFVEQANKVTLLSGEYLSSYDVTALFTLVPLDPALGIIRDLLEKR